MVVKLGKVILKSWYS